MNMPKLFFAFLLACSQTCLWGQSQLAQDPRLAQRLYDSGLIHQPLPLDTARSHEAAGWSKKILKSSPLSCDPKHWSHDGEGHLSYCPQPSLTGQGSICLQFPTSTGRRAVGPENDPDYAMYGHSAATYRAGGKNWEDYNRLVFYIYPDCEGARVVNINVTFTNADTPAKEGYNRPSGAHLVNLTNKQWNRCYLEIDEYQRDQVEALTFSVNLQGKDRTTGDTSTYYIDNLQLQTIEQPDKTCGWMPQKGKIIYSGTGYFCQGRKTAFMAAPVPVADPTFRLVDASSRNIVFEGQGKQTDTSIGRYLVFDFSEFTTPGEYLLETASGTSTRRFRIGDRIWEDSQWRVLNFIFCQRCGYPVPGKHDACHADLISVHDGKQVAFNGGWHDAGDLSQQTLQTADVVYALLEAAEARKAANPALAARLVEEAEWGLEFVLKNRLGDGWHASSMGLLIWQDGIWGTTDDIRSVRTQNHAFDNFLYAAYEAYAAQVLRHDPMKQDYLRKVAEEDFDYAWQKFQREGYDRFVQPYEHTYNTSHSQYQATISWAASQLYRLTGKDKYARLAAEHIRYVLDCQRTEPLNDPQGTRGFFYRDRNRKSIVHFIHQSREQVYIQALTLLCQTQPGHADRPQWEKAIRLYGDYLKGLMPYTAPYGMIPSGVYHQDEYKDSVNFYALHLFPPTDADRLYREQLKGGVRLDKEHYVKRFPIWFNIFNGNTAIHLSTGKAAALCGHYLNDPELLDIGRWQLYWTVGMNPFGQSLIYGEGYDYPQMNNFSSGESTGEMPVGIRTLGNGDEPYWPQTNNACYKEVWVTSAGKWLSLLAEY